LGGKKSKNKLGIKNRRTNWGAKAEEKVGQNNKEEYQDVRKAG
jgi:hypothetical protein